MLLIKRWALTILVIFLVAIIPGCSKNQEESYTEEIDLSEEVKIIEAFGLVKAEKNKNVIIDFPATVEEVLVKEGQQINFGDPIMTLDISEYLSKIHSTENEVIVAKLEEEILQKNIYPLFTKDKELEIEKLVNDLNFATEVYKQYLDRFNSYKKLFEAGAISQQEFDEAKRNMDEKKKAIDNINYKIQETNYLKEKELEEFHLKKSSQNHKLQIQRKKIVQIENQLLQMYEKLNKLNIKDNQIICDFEKAVIYDIGYDVGDIVSPTSKIFSITSLDSLTVEANIVEDFIKDVQIGLPVKIVPIADRGKEYRGKIIYISNMAFKEKGETVIPVSIFIDNPDNFLMPNYNVDVFIEIYSN